MKARPAKSKKRTLHQPPAEFAKAKRVHATEKWQQTMEADRVKIEKGLSVVMPAHRRPLTFEEYLDKHWH